MRSRLWWARWQRLWRWEFWPVWAVYPPVLLSWLWHAIRLRGFTLAPIGTHSRGALFTDERKLIGDPLREAFDEMGSCYQGFQFGRYDVKVPSIADLRAGKNLVVLELNGVMGEPAHIYQPGYPWWRGMRDLCGHFRLAAEIGAAWRNQGVTPPGVREVIDLIRQHRETTYLEVDENQREC